MDFALRHHRAKLIRKYRQNPSPWPDGIGKWYVESEWPQDLVELWSTPGWLDDQARGVTRVTPVTGNVTLDVTQPTKEDLRRRQVRERVARFRAEKAKRDAGG